MRSFQRALACALALACVTGPAFAANLPGISGPSGGYQPTSGAVIVNPDGVFCDFRSGGNCASGAASENHIGVVGGVTNINGATFTTPAGTTAYASGDLIANSATAGSVTPLTFSACRVAAGTGMIRRARIKTPDTGFAGKVVTLKLYKDSPTPTNGDNGAWLTTESNYIGAIDVTLDQTFTDAVKGIGQPNTGSEINFECAAGSSNIYGLLVAGGAITPQGSKLFTVMLEALVN